MDRKEILLKLMPAVRMSLSSNYLLSCSYREGDNATSVEKERVLRLEQGAELPAFLSLLEEWRNKGRELPKAVVLEGSGSIHIDDKPQAESCPGRMQGRITVVTGGAQGFGGGIAEELFHQGANVVIADLNEELGKETCKRLNRENRPNRAYSVKTDVSDPASVEELMLKTIEHFGGIDVFISNAGVLHAGGLDEMDPKTFDFVTKVNYNGFFYCTKYSSPVMAEQAKYKEDYYSDIIQINSKSGLKGSKKNFAYAGGKFGGIGLTQSFALELIENRTKVNAICPGNFFEGPLWSDPEHGLFVQYLNAGKVPGAETLDDVKKYYEDQVPAGRGCTPLDVARAIFYVIEQEYETGQAIPVTGGQNMLH